MTTIRAHYDGKVIVPDESLDLPIGQPLALEVRPLPPMGSDGDAAARRKALDEFLALAVGGACIPAESLHREQLYEDRA